MEKHSEIALKRVLAEIHKTEDNPHFPNSNLPVLIYRGAVDIKDGDYFPFVTIFKENKWGSEIWMHDVYNVHHYHSNTHEVLGIYSGCAKLQFGGPEGIVTEVHKGDIVLIPAGTAHKNLGATHDFSAVGAYPDGFHYNMNYGEDNERPYTDDEVSRVELPLTDPVYGKGGDMFKYWDV